MDERVAAARVLDRLDGFCLRGRGLALLCRIESDLSGYVCVVAVDAHRNVDGMRRDDSCLCRCLLFAYTSMYS